VVLLEDLIGQSFEAAFQTEVIAQQILYSLNQPYRLDGHEYHLSPIIGVTLFNDHEAVIDVITLLYGNLLS
jgi:hypothetical protein